MPGAMQTVGGKINVTYDSYTRQNDTTQYTIGDIVADATPTVLTFDAAAAHSGGSGIIQNAILIDGANQSTKLDADLFIFTAAPASFGNDNAACTFTDAELLTCVGVINFPTTAWNGGDLTAGATGNAICQVVGLSIPFKCANDTSKLYGVLVARNAYTPIAQSPIYAKLLILQD